MLSRQHSW